MDKRRLQSTAAWKVVWIRRFNVGLKCYAQNVNFNSSTNTISSNTKANFNYSVLTSKELYPIAKLFVRQ